MRSDECVNEKIHEGFFLWFGHVERVYIGVCAGAGSCLVSRPRRRWIDIMKECLKKRGFDVGKQGEWCMIGVYGGGL